MAGMGQWNAEGKDCQRANVFSWSGWVYSSVADSLPPSTEMFAPCHEARGAARTSQRWSGRHDSDVTSRDREDENSRTEIHGPQSWELRKQVEKQRDGKHNAPLTKWESATAASYFLFPWRRVTRSMCQERYYVSWFLWVQTTKLDILDCAVWQVKNTL